MQVVIKRIDELKRAEKNVRFHGDRQIKEYIRSIEMFGQIRPLVVDENNVVICGNGLLQAFQTMGKETAECYVVVGLSENKKKKLMLTDNKIYELGVNNAKVFDDMLKELAGDIDIPGYDENLLKVLTANAQEADKYISSYGTFSDDRINRMKKNDGMPRIALTVEGTTEQVINANKEIDTKDFSSEKFNCTCPRCGFKFNV